MKTWERAERKIAVGVRGRRTPGSGNGNIKGDVITREWCIEVKETSRQPMIFHFNWLRKAALEASRMRRKPALVVELHDGSNLCFVPTDEEANKTVSGKFTMSLNRGDLSPGDVISVSSLNWKVLDLSEFEEVMDGINE